MEHPNATEFSAEQHAHLISFLPLLEPGTISLAQSISYYIVCPVEQKAFVYETGRHRQNWGTAFSLIYFTFLWQPGKDSNYSPSVADTSAAWQSVLWLVHALDDRRILVRIPTVIRRFNSSVLNPDLLWGPPSLLVNGYGRGTFPQKSSRGPESEADHLPPSTAEFRKTWSYDSIPPCLHGTYRDNELSSYNLVNKKQKILC